jgi:predicted transcriptional regulator
VRSVNKYLGANSQQTGMSGACCVAQCAGSDCLQLTDRELLVCETVCESSEPLGFSAVKRSVGLHQELVSRILRRLTTYGAIEKVQEKYKRRAVNN